MMIKRILVLAVIAIAIYGGIKFFNQSNKAAIENTQNVAPAVLSVTVVSPKQKTVNETINVTGMTVPREEVQVMTELSGIRVLDVFADVGGLVKKGDKLAVLDAESLKNQLAQLQADYNRAQEDYNRVEALINSPAISKQTVTERQTTLKVAKARLDDAELNIKRSIIVAPEDGVIIERKATLGALVSSSEPLYRIAKENKIELEASVPEAALSKIERGKDVTVRLSGNTEEIKGTVRLVTPRINTSTRMASIRIELPQGKVSAVGLFANATITTKSVSGFVLPATAIQIDDQGQFIWRLTSDNKAERLGVKILSRSDDEVVIENIATDSRIVARAGAFIKAGESVKPVEGGK